VTSVNAYTSMMRISIKDKYLIKSLSENKKYGTKQLFKCFLTKTGLKALIKKLTTQVLLFDVLGSGQPRIVRTVPVLSIFLISTFSPSVFVRKQFKQLLCSIFLIKLIKVDYFLVKI